MKIDIEKIDKLVKKADQIFLTPDGEKVLVKLLNIQKQVEDAIDEAKARLEKTALKKSKNFSSIQGDRVKVYYRAYGSRFYVDESNADMLPEGLAEKVWRYQVNNQAVEAYVNEKGQMPVGIKEVDRKKSISISLKDK